MTEPFMVIGSRLNGLSWPKGVDDCGKTAGRNGDVVFRPDISPGGFGEGRAPHAVDDQAPGRGGKSLCVTRRATQTSCAGHDHLAAATATAGYYRQAARLRLEYCHPERLVDSGPYIKIGSSQSAGDRCRT